VPPLGEVDEHEHLAGKHGLFLDTAIALREFPWNDKFGGGRVVANDDGGGLLSIELEGDLTITLLSPTLRQLKELGPEWDSSVQGAGLGGASVAEVLEEMEDLHYRTDLLADTGTLGHKPSGPIEIDKLLAIPDSRDNTKANGASIAFVATFAGRSILFTGDAHADVLLDSIKKMVGSGSNQKLRVGAVKLAHHGSKNNVSIELLKKLDTRTFLVSTNGGSGHYHPDREAIARIVAGTWREAPSEETVRLLFNYENDYTKIWDDEDLKREYNYEVYFPADGDVLQMSPVPKTP
jgi:hypothetical protein